MSLSDISEPEWVEREVVNAAHDLSIAEHGGASGLRDEGLLLSALDRPKNPHHYEGVADIPLLAATYAVGLAKNHPFADGNKRTAFIVCAAFLLRNGMRLTADQVDSTTTMLAVASGEMEIDALADWIRANSRAA